MKVFVDLGPSTNTERELREGAKPMIDAILGQDPPENYGLENYTLLLNGKPASRFAEIYDGDHISIIPK